MRDHLQRCNGKPSHAREQREHRLSRPLPIIHFNKAKRGTASALKLSMLFNDNKRVYVEQRPEHVVNENPKIRTHGKSHVSKKQTLARRSYTTTNHPLVCLYINILNSSATANPFRTQKNTTRRCGTRSHNQARYTNSMNNQKIINAPDGFSKTLPRPSTGRVRA